MALVIESQDKKTLKPFAALARQMGLKVRYTRVVINSREKSEYEFETNAIPQYNDEYDKNFLSHIDEIENELSNPDNIIKFKNADSAIDYLKKKCL
jgi:hypothetical protein